MVGVRLDSGDLAYLSIEARKLLDANGFPGAAIVASNDLDESIIAKSLYLIGQYPANTSSPQSEYLWGSHQYHILLPIRLANRLRYPLQYEASPVVTSV